MPSYVLSLALFSVWECLLIILILLLYIFILYDPLSIFLTWANITKLKAGEVQCQCDFTVQYSPVFKSDDKALFLFDWNNFYILEMGYRRENVGSIGRVPSFFYFFFVCPPPPSCWRHKFKPEAQFIVPDWGDKVYYGIVLSYRSAMLNRLAGRYNNSMS